VGTESQLQLAKDLLIAADVPPLQVLIEARILEVAPETVLNAGFEWVDNATGKLTGTTIAEKGPHGFAIGRVTRTRFDDVSVRVQALLQDRKSRVLASPQLKIVDGGVAEIFSGTNFTGSLVPEDNPLSGTTTLLGVTHTGVQLLVNPQVHLGKDGVPSQITVRIVPSVSAPLLREGSKKVPDRILRRMDTTVLLRDGEMLAIGGLINEDEIREIQKVPLLSEIPYLGELFKRRKVDRRRSELMVVLTARVLIPGRDIPLATREFQDQVPALAGFTLTPQVKAGDPPTDAVPEDGRVAGLVRLVAAAPAGGMDVRLELPDSPAALGLEFEQVTGLRTGQGADDVQDARTILVHVPAGEYLARFHFRAAVKHQDRVVPIQAVVGSQKRTIRLHIFELK
jgi:type II secretory pathway component GspD/PulD (secretin)